jgi:hypothetical protein
MIASVIASLPLALRFSCVLNIYRMITRTLMSGSVSISRTGNGAIAGIASFKRLRPKLSIRSLIDSQEHVLVCLAWLRIPTEPFEVLVHSLWLVGLSRPVLSLALLIFALTKL